jgi:hypothetical protein
MPSAAGILPGRGLSSFYERSTAFIDSADRIAGKKDSPATQGKPVAHLEI